MAIMLLKLLINIIPYAISSRVGNLTIIFFELSSSLDSLDHSETRFTVQEGDGGKCAKPDTTMLFEVCSRTERLDCKWLRQA
jgi:hypothetical protein